MLYDGTKDSLTPEHIKSLHKFEVHQCLQCTGHPNLAVTISVISVILTSLLFNVPHIINKFRVILYFIQNRDIPSRTLN